MIITGVILAAGTSSRMGSSNKLLLKYKNHTIIEEVVQQLSNSKVDNILIVTGFENTRLEKLPAIHQSDRIDLIYNRDYRLGRAHSIKCAVERIKDKANAALFMVADKPELKSTLINRAIDRFRKDKPSLLYVKSPTGRGHPIIFSEKLFDDLMHLEGDCVGNELVSRYKNDTIRLNDETPQIDVDDMDDYRTLLENG